MYWFFFLLLLCPFLLVSYCSLYQATAVLFYPFSSSPNPSLQILERERMHFHSFSGFPTSKVVSIPLLNNKAYLKAFVHNFSLLPNITYTSVYFHLILSGNLSTPSKILQFPSWNFPWELAIEIRNSLLVCCKLLRFCFPVFWIYVVSTCSY